LRQPSPHPNPVIAASEPQSHKQTCKEIADPLASLRRNDKMGVNSNFGEGFTIFLPGYILGLIEYSFLVAIAVTRNPDGARLFWRLACLSTGAADAAVTVRCLSRDCGARESRMQL
jgi:hypothetical protein